MHSSKLRGSDFRIEVEGRTVSHADFFADWGERDRLGVYAPQGWEGAGAAAFILASVTAFYDRHRARDESFYAYPDYFTFQRRHEPADYGMLDLWPKHKQVSVPEDANAIAAAITDRGVTLLLLPDRSPGEVHLEPVQRAALERNVERYMLYSGSGEMEESAIEIEAPCDSLAEWILRVFQSMSSGEYPEEVRAEWERRAKAGGRFRQSLREVSAEEAWGRLSR